MNEHAKAPPNTKEEHPFIDAIEAHARAIVDAIQAGNGGEAVFFAGEILRECERARSVEALDPPSARDTSARDTSARDTSARDTASQEGESGPRYVGKPIDLDLKDADIGNVCRLLADVGKVNIVLGDGVQGKVTLTMHHVPWDQALDAVIAAKGLRTERDGNVILVFNK